MPIQRGTQRDARYMKRARAALGWTQQEMADLLGVSQGTVSEIEGRNTPIQFLMRKEIERALARREAVGMLDLGYGRNAVLCERAGVLSDQPDYAALLQHAETCVHCLVRTAFTT